MSTTALVAELLVIGVGAAIWLVLIVLTFLGFDWVELEDLSKAIGLIPAVAVVYLLGIVVDRVADKLFKPWSDKIRLRQFSTIEAFQTARGEVYERSPLRGLFEYSRSRLRICRSWTFNAVLSACAANAFIVAQLEDGVPRFRLSVVATAVLLGIGTACTFSWYQLCETEARNVELQWRLLRGQSTSKAMPPEEGGCAEGSTE